MRTQLALLIVLLAAPLIDATHTEEDALGNEAAHIDFESPMQPFFAPQSDVFTASTTGTGSGTSLVKTSPPADMEGVQSWNTAKTSAGSTTYNGVLDFGAGYDFCAVDTGVAEFEFIWDSGTAAVTRFIGGFYATDLTSSATVTLTLTLSTGALAGNIGSNAISAAGSFATTLVQDTKYTFRIQGMDCDNGSVTFVNMNNGESVSLDLTGTGHVFSPLRYFLSGTRSSADSATHSFWLDSMTIPGATSGFTGASFCPDPFAESFAFSYNEDVVYRTQSQAAASGIGMDDFFLFTAQSDDAAYLAKHFDSGISTQDAYVRFTIEAGSDATGSIFAVRFSFEDPHLNAWVAADELTSDAKGNGEDTGSFENYVGVEFTEDGNDWHAQVRKSISGSESTSGQAWTGGSPNTASSFVVDINTNEGDDYIALRTDSGTNLINLTLPTGEGDPIYSIWFVGEGTASIESALTGLNDNDGTWDSSCMFARDLSQEDSPFAGADGTTPSVPTDDPTDAPTGDFPGVDTSAFSTGLGISEAAGGWIIALFLIVGLSGGLALFGVWGFSLGALLGFGMSIAFGLIPLWFLLFTILLIAAVIVLYAKGR